MVSKIKKLEDVKRFAKHLVNDLHLNFNPDDYFACYNLLTFSAAKAAHYNALMNECFEVCEKDGANLYETIGQYLKTSNKGVKCIKDFLEKCGNLENETFEYEAYNDILCFYARQPLLFKHKLAPLLYSFINSSAIAAAKDENSKPSLLGSNIKKLSSWITYDTILLIKKLVNEKFANLDDLQELNEAFEYDYITNDQYFLKYQQVTRDYNAYKFMAGLSEYKRCKFPLNIQWYVVSRIIELLGFKKLYGDDNSIKLNDGHYINGICDLMAWFSNEALCGNITGKILRRAEEEICSDLSDDDRWFGFEQGDFQSPGEANIRKRLEEAYQVIKTHSKSIIDTRFFNENCFQDIMLSDLEKISDTDSLIFIVNHLDEMHRNLVRQKTPHLLELYFKKKYTSGNYRKNDDYQTYDRYNGSYAQDEMGYSDDDIDTIFDGDPDAYWNID